jgi:uncharacterized RDD family membrane protein YckC
MVCSRKEPGERKGSRDSRYLDLPAIYPPLLTIRSVQRWKHFVLRAGTATLARLRAQDRMRRDTGALSTLAQQPTADLNWKQEVNQRIAAHKRRKEPGAADRPLPATGHFGANSRAAEAAARVAARYAHAPSYNQMLAEEARAAVRAAEAASEVALKMQAAAESVLAELESAAGVEPELERERDEGAFQRASAAPETFFDPFLELERPIAPVEQHVPASGLVIRWEPDLPVRSTHPARVRATRRTEQLALTLEDWRGPATGYGEPELVEPAQPIHANLIEFPRELIAARKARPRIAEGPLAPEGGTRGQLSIFEVDPGSICTQPLQADSAVETHAPGWSRLRLDAERWPEPAAESAAQAHPIQLAPLGLRLMAAVVDAAMMVAILVVAGMVAAANIDSQPAMKTMEIAGAAALFAIGVLYQGLFFMTAGTTPGMRYAGISLCTFDDQNPTREQMRRRIGAMILSLLPVGLGVLWAIFDEDHLSWHDRISRTYQRCG